ncbi:MAG: AAA family ATPase [Deltaproteobacteria bacterium]|nr:AAA family ATPase [Candidatus Zymogenaceae bacterium]
MKIDQIKLMRDCFVFRNFSWPSNLPEFKRYNLIYGWNGSGKTTLSRIFQALENQEEPPFSNITLKIDGYNISNEDFTKSLRPIRVFNKPFREESVFPKGGSVAPILVLGKENVEKQKLVDKLNEDLDIFRKSLETKNREKNVAQEKYESFCTEKAGNIREMLRSSGDNKFNTYDKRDVKACADKMIILNNKASSLIDQETRNKYHQRIHDKPKDKIQEIDFTLPKLINYKKDVDDILHKTVVSSAIESLKSDSQLTSWIFDGLGLHKERSAKKCLFCDQPISEKRISRLESHFSSEYSDLINELDKQIKVLEKNINELENLNTPKIIEFYDDLKFEYEKVSNDLNKESKSVVFALKGLVSELENKKNRAFEQVSLDTTIPDLDINIFVENTNNVIAKHNRSCDEFESKIIDIRNALEMDFVSFNLDEYTSLKNNISSIENDIKELNFQIEEISNQIREIEREIVEHRRPAEELNDDLRKYLGHTELHLKINETGYTIMRHDEPAKDISEGEMTAIALLYFLKSLKDKRFNLEESIVVLDDPVSSLDTNSLYYVR